LGILANSVAPLDLACAFDGVEISQAQQPAFESTHEDESENCCDDEASCNLCGVCHPAIALLQQFASDPIQGNSPRFSKINTMRTMFEPGGPEEPPRPIFLS
jgi:hypothetical protein